MIEVTREVERRILANTEKLIEMYEKLKVENEELKKKVNKLQKLKRVKLVKEIEEMSSEKICLEFLEREKEDSLGENFIEYLEILKSRDVCYFVVEDINYIFNNRIVTIKEVVEKLIKEIKNPTIDNIFKKEMVESILEVIREYEPASN